MWFKKRIWRRQIFTRKVKIKWDDRKFIILIRVILIKDWWDGKRLKFKIHKLNSALTNHRALDATLVKWNKKLGYFKWNNKVKLRVSNERKNKQLRSGKVIWND